MYSSVYEQLDAWYAKGWARKDQIVEFVKLDQITKDEYKKITGEAFPE